MNDPAMKNEVDVTATLQRIDDLVQQNPIVLFMKGDPIFPMCGYSSRVASLLNQNGSDFVHVNVLTDPSIYAVLPQYRNWNTFPQLYVSGELVGGCDIVEQLAQTDQLDPLLAQATASQATSAKPD